MKNRTIRWLRFFLASVIAAEVGLVLGPPPAVGQQERTLPPPRTPLSLRLADAFVEGQSLQTLPVVAAEEIAQVNRLSRQLDANLSLKPPRVGFTRAVRDITLAEANGGKWRQLPNGQRLWTSAIRSPGAYGLRIHFRKFEVGDDTVLVYAREGNRVRMRGTYTGKGPNSDGTFWSAMLPGDTSFIELVTGNQKTPTIEIDKVVHVDQPLSGLTSNRQKQEPPNPSNSLSPQVLGCHLDPACQPQSSYNAAAHDASVIIFYIKSTGEMKACSGTMLRDLDNATEVPYLLTAYHCLSTQAEANSLQVYFRYQNNVCGGTPSLANLPTTLGATLLGANPTDGGNDMAFLRLNPIQGLSQDAPPLQFAEWSLANGLTDPSYGIHHPASSFKRITFFGPSDYVLCPDIDAGDDGDYFLADPTNGGIEGGSSGSGLFDSSGRLLGQLKGRCGPGTDDNGNCSDEDGWRAVYGKFNISYTIGQVGRWLEIGGTINVNRFYTGEELGTPDKPFRTLAAANNLLNQYNWNGARIKVQAGCYPEPGTFSRPVTILSNGGTVKIGTCP